MILFMLALVYDLELIVRYLNLFYSILMKGLYNYSFVEGIELVIHTPYV